VRRGTARNGTLAGASKFEEPRKPRREGAAPGTQTPGCFPEWPGTPEAPRLERDCIKKDRTEAPWFFRKYGITGRATGRTLRRRSRTGWESENESRPSENPNQR